MKLWTPEAIKQREDHGDADVEYVQGHVDLSVYRNLHLRVCPPRHPNDPVDLSRMH